MWSYRMLWCALPVRSYSIWHTPCSQITTQRCHPGAEWKLRWPVKECVCVWTADWLTAWFWCRSRSTERDTWLDGERAKRRGGWVLEGHWFFNREISILTERGERAAEQDTHAHAHANTHTRRTREFPLWHVGKFHNIFRALKSFDGLI